MNKQSFLAASFLLVAMLLGILLGGCGRSNKQAVVGTGNNQSVQERSKIRLGTTGGTHEEIAKKAREIAAKEGLTIEVVPFNDGTQINKATAEKSIDANAFQHMSYFNNSKKANNLDLVKIANTYIMPMAIYSQKIKNVADLPDGATVALPGDPANLARALMLFEKVGWIKLRQEAGMDATVRDVVENPKKLKFKEMDAAMILPVLGDLDAAAVNTNIALDFGLHPAKDGLYTEDSTSPWVCIIAVRPQEKDDPGFKKLVAVYNSEAMRQYLVERFGGAVVPGW